MGHSGLEKAPAPTADQEVADAYDANDEESSTRFSASGPLPEASADYNDSPAPSASDQAFGEEEDEHQHAAAKRWNAAHPHFVAQFNDATTFRCMHEGQLSVKRVIEYQTEHNLSADGMIGPHTVAVAEKNAGRGKPPKEAFAPGNETYDDFVAVNGPPEQAAPAHAAHAAKTQGVPSEKFEPGTDLYNDFVEVNGPPGQTAAPAAQKTVGTPSEAFEPGNSTYDDFVAVNGGPGQPAPAAPAATTAAPKTVGKPSEPFAPGNEVYDMFVEENGGPGQPAPKRS